MLYLNRSRPFVEAISSTGSSRHSLKVPTTAPTMVVQICTPLLLLGYVGGRFCYRHIRGTYPSSLGARRLFIRFLPVGHSLLDPYQYIQHRFWGHTDVVCLFADVSACPWNDVSPTTVCLYNVVRSSIRFDLRCRHFRSRLQLYSTHITCPRSTTY